jgi:hypothetical protein
MSNQQQNGIQQIPLGLVGSTKFGKYPKITTEETYNMIISDSALVPYAGFAAQLQLSTTGTGRGAYASTAANFTIAVVGNGVFLIYPLLNFQLVGNLNTTIGDVFIAENNNKEIAITDYSNIYVYNWGTGKFSVSTTSISPIVGQFTIPSNLTHPGYITFQDGRLIVAGIGTTNWFLSALNQATVWTGVGTYIGALQTKTDFVQAPVRMPGRGNYLFVFGSTVGESWTDQGLVLFPYVKSTSFNLDYGCLNAATIAYNENYICWISQNEKSGPALMVTDGGSIKRISTDGIDYRLSNLTNPKDCYGFFFRQDGHLIYQFTFPTDNLSYAYDFNTERFFTVTDENLNYHPAKVVVFFGDVYYFVSNKDGNFYEFDTSITDFTYSLPGLTFLHQKEIPRIRITPPLRLPTEEAFITRNARFTIENGQPNLIRQVPVPQPIQRTVITTESGYFITTETGQVIETTNFMGVLNFPISEAGVDLSVSNDGGQTFGNSWRLNMNKSGKGKSLFIWRQLGRANDRTFMYKFWGFKRFVALEGIAEIYK